MANRDSDSSQFDDHNNKITNPYSRCWPNHRVNLRATIDSAKYLSQRSETLCLTGYTFKDNKNKEEQYQLQGLRRLEVGFEGNTDDARKGWVWM